jgi:hypothetical protein
VRQFVLLISFVFLAAAGGCGGGLSPATTQMVIDIQQGGGSIAGYPKIVALLPTSGGCTSTIASTSCQIIVSLAAGSYTATLTAEDPVGNALRRRRASPSRLLPTPPTASRLRSQESRTNSMSHPGRAPYTVRRAKACGSTDRHRRPSS